MTPASDPLVERVSNTLIEEGGNVAQLLTFLKADAVLRKNVGAAIEKEFLSNDDMEILSFETRRVDAALSAEHYAHVADRPFYPWLEYYVTACPVYVMLIEVADDAAVERLRAFLGKTQAHEAAPETIRGRFGIYAGVNCVHLSDSVESGRRETDLWRAKLGIRKGQFDLTPEEYARRYDPSLPNHTQELREICVQMAKAGSASDDQKEQIRSYLKQENPDITPKQLETLLRIILGSAV
ncbi:MAG: nucleoside-diphosphate kinase [Anaerolineales bacterium]